MICGFLWDISMNNINTNRTLWALGIIAVIVSLAKFKLDGTTEFTFQTIFDYLSIIVSAWSIITFIFVKFTWKWKIFYKWLVRIPNLNGLWSGKIQSTYQDGKQIDAELEIVQTLFEVKCILTTEESRSSSISCDFILDSDTLNDKLSYVYRNEPSIRNRDGSSIHYGSAVFDIIANELKGCYWTDRKTTGEMIFEKKK